MDWKFLKEAHVGPLEWDWVLRNGLYHPVYTEQPTAPADVHKFVRCKCKLSNCSCKRKMDYTVLQHVDIVAVTAVKTKISQRIWRTRSVKKMKPLHRHRKSMDWFLYNRNTGLNWVDEK